MDSNLSQHLVIFKQYNSLIAQCFYLATNKSTISPMSKLTLKKKQIPHLLAVLIPTLALNLPVNADSFSAKNTGQGFTGITHDYTSSLSNPALLTQYNSKNDVYLSFNLGGMGSDQYEVMDGAENIANNLDRLADDINLQQTSSDDLQAQVDVIIDDLERINNKVVNVRNGINFQLIIPTNSFNFGFFTNQYGRIGGVTSYDKSDKALLEQAIEQKQLNLEDLQSTANGIGYSIAEAGLMFGYQVINQTSYELNIGTKIKYQRTDLFYNRLNISEFDDNEFELDNEQYLTNKTAANLDLGVYVAWGDNRQWHASLVTNNLFSQEVHHSEQDLIFKLETTTSIGFSYHHDWVTLSTAFDLIDREHFIDLMPSKYASIGAEFNLTEDTKLRLGVRNDLNGVDGDLYTFGVGFSPWQILTVDMAAFAGNNDTIGAAIQFGFKV